MAVTIGEVEVVSEPEGARPTPARELRAQPALDERLLARLAARRHHRALRARAT